MSVIMLVADDADRYTLPGPGSGRASPAGTDPQSTGHPGPGRVAMPIRSRHLPMSFEEWDLLPYQPGWKYEYWDGCAHITPNHQTAVTTATVTPRPVNAPCMLRHVLP